MGPASGPLPLNTQLNLCAFRSHEMQREAPKSLKAPIFALRASREIRGLEHRECSFLHLNRVCTVFPSIPIAYRRTPVIPAVHPAPSLALYRRLLAFRPLARLR